MTEQGESAVAPPDDLDVPGLAGERTDLAWSRTALAVGVATTALIRQSWELVDTVTGRVAVFSICGLGALAWTAAFSWAHLFRTTLEGRPIADRRHLFVLTVGTTAFAAAALVIAIVAG